MCDHGSGARVGVLPPTEPAHVQREPRVRRRGPRMGEKPEGSGGGCGGGTAFASGDRSVRRALEEAQGEGGAGVLTSPPPPATRLGTMTKALARQPRHEDQGGSNQPVQCVTLLI